MVPTRKNNENQRYKQSNTPKSVPDTQINPNNEVQNTMNKKIYKAIGMILTFCMIGSVAMASYHIGRYSQYSKTHPRIEYETYANGEWPEEAKVKMDMVNSVQNWLLLALPLTMLIYLADHMRQPEGSLLTKVSNFIQYLWKLEENDEEDEQ